ncbi:STAS domain-containing protein [Georgenia sp. SUBG003]|uniref:STAS domain-containing protein n=1 Tax=Georgenia sp. SUBG003 TaxID=1497974 RepID=UPI000693D95D
MTTTTDPAARWREQGTVAVLTTGGSVRLVLSGPIDQLCAADLDEAVREAVVAGLPVEVDTRNVTFMDSSAVAALQALTRASPLRATFIRPTDLVRFLLQVTHLGDSVEIRGN